MLRCIDKMLGIKEVCQIYTQMMGQEAIIDMIQILEIEGNLLKHSHIASQTVRVLITVDRIKNMLTFKMEMKLTTMLLLLWQLEIHNHRNQSLLKIHLRMLNNIDQ